MIVTIYIDESGTHGEASPVTIMGGWVGRLGQWAGFDPKWKRLLKRSSLTYFHSKKMRHSKGEFKGWGLDDKERFMTEASKIGRKNLEFGFTIILPEDAYQEHYLAGHRPREVQLDSRYGLCFRYCLGVIPAFAMQSFKKKDLDISFVLEDGHKNFGDALRIFKKVKKSRVPHEQEIVRTLRTVTPGAKIEFPGLQIADVVAYNSFQHVTRNPFPTTPLKSADPENYMAEAKKNQRVPVIHARLGEAELKGFKQFILDEVEEKKARRKKPTSADPASSEERSPA